MVVVLLQGWFCKSQIHESDVHFLCSLSTKKDDACNKTQQQIHDGGAQDMKVKPTLNKLRKLVTPPNALDPIYTFLYLWSLSVKHLGSLDGGFRTSECPYWGNMWLNGQVAGNVSP